MAKRNYYKKQDNSGIIEEQVKPTEATVMTEGNSGWISIRSKYHVKYIYNSVTTGERYEWGRAGSIVSVHPDDAPALLAKFRKNGCCGSAPQKNYIFEEAE